MAAFSPHHLLEQAESLTAASSAGPPRQADLRRAISTAYYAVFHHALTASADEFIGKTHRNSPRYALAFRSIDHKDLRELCVQATKQKPSPRYAQFIPASGFDHNLQAFAAMTVDLQHKRHSADYDPLLRVAMSDARSVVAAAKSALTRFDRAPAKHRKTFLTLLAFPPR